MSIVQPGILDPVPLCSRYLFFSLRPNASIDTLRGHLESLADGDRLVVGLGRSLVDHLGGGIDPLHAFPAHSHQGIDIPSTPCALWCWLRGDDRGELLQRGRALEQRLTDDFCLEQAVDGFRYREGRDLTGYEDGTENPEGEEAVLAAITRTPEALAGSSFVAVQQWRHDLPAFEAMNPRTRDAVMGRRLQDNTEIDDAPPAAHVKRTAQESYTPQAFMLRRSMPWVEGREAGLMFVAFGHSLEAFEAQLRRMVGLEDGIPDALFRFTRPVSGSCYWCPPLHEGRLDLSALNQ